MKIGSLPLHNPSQLPVSVIDRRSVVCSDWPAACTLSISALFSPHPSARAFSSGTSRLQRAASSTRAHPRRPRSPVHGQALSFSEPQDGDVDVLMIVLQMKEIKASGRSSEAWSSDGRRQGQSDGELHAARRQQLHRSPLISLICSSLTHFCATLNAEQTIVMRVRFSERHSLT